MRDRSIPIIIVVAVIAAIALGTGFHRVPNSENPYLRNIELTFGGEHDGDSAETSATSGTTTSASRHVVEAGDASTTAITLEQAAGELTVRSAAAGPLLDAGFDVAPRAWTPRVDYRVSGGEGVLDVVQGEPGACSGDSRNMWDLKLGGGLPTALVVKHGAGKAELVLGELTLSSLRYTAGAGEATVDLSGAATPTADVPVVVEAGIGQINLVLPAGVPLRLAIEQGLGDVNVRGLTSEGATWVSDAYRAGQPAYVVRVAHGAGEVIVRVTP